MKKRSKKHDLHHKSFWISIAFLFILSFLVLINSQGSGVTGDAAVQTIAFMKAGSQLDFEVRNINGVKQVTIWIKENVKNSVIQFEEIDKLAWDFQGIAISKFRVSSADENKFSNLEFLLRVQERDLQSAGLTSKDIFLYHNGKRLDTSFVEQKDNFFYFKATSNGLGDFVIGKANLAKVGEAITVVVPEQPRQEEPAPMPEEKLSFWARIVLFFKGLFD